jgi:diguanylate cyclase (GGDEF)-like protein|tara:strand:- start:4504 stop:5163 length:660 start_codon:yes stop_codon:yes gene_type:complete
MTKNDPTYDKLTGLLKREMFEAEFATRISQANEHRYPLTLAMVDLDSFLKINQDHGQKGGDEVLRVLAATLRSNVSDETLVFRFGGDEFILLFLDTSREQAFLSMERIRGEMEQRETYGEAEIQATISVGIASCPVDGNAADELLRKADQALYRAKLAGSNQVLLAQDERMVPKTTHYTETQLERLSSLAEEMEIKEARLLREALDDVIKKYKLTGIEN